jgi:uncharacterized protein YkwD/uncharacterized membrane protein required for colicin V production
MTMEPILGWLQNHWIEIVIVVVVGVFAMQGYVRGFALWVLDIIGLIAAILLAFRFYGPVSEFLGSIGVPLEFQMVAAFLLVFFVVQFAMIILGGTLGRSLHPSPDGRPIDVVNRLAGIPVGAIFGLAVTAMFLTLMLRLPVEPLHKDAITRSPMAERLVASPDRLPNGWREMLVPDGAERLFQVRRVSEEESIQLPFRSDSGRPAPQLEEQMIELVNGERAAVGLPPLAFDAQLRTIARNHSDDMLRSGFFSHRSPNTGDPADRARAVGYQFRVIGENIALAPTLAIAHRGLMESRGHRENILRPEYTRIGIGILDAGIEGLMVTQNFSR